MDFFSFSGSEAQSARYSLFCFAELNKLWRGMPQLVCFWSDG